MYNILILFQMIIPPSQMFWRILGGGHFLQVETCSNGVTWAIGYDSKPWVYTGGWGGAHFKGVSSSSKFGLGPIDDAKYFYIYENQRWNPLTGFTSHGLPTDRYGESLVIIFDVLTDFNVDNISLFLL